MERNRSSFQVHQATEIVPGVILGGLRDLDDMLAMKPDVLVPLDRLPGYIWEDGYRGEILYMPIVDQSILPESVLEFFIDQLLERICEKRRIAIFCIGGHGRTGYIASCLLYRLGIRDPITYIRKNYSMKAVETDEQEDAVQAYCREHQPGFEKEKYQNQLRLRLTLSLEDPAVLRELALHDSYTGVRIAAVSRLQGKDQEICREIAADLSLNPLLRAEAVSWIQDKELLRIYKEDDDWEVNLAAIVALDDQELFKKIAYDPDEWNLYREEVTEHIKDEDTLFDLAMHFTKKGIGDAELARIAAEHVSDPEHLAAIAAGAADPDAAEAAAKRLQDERKRNAFYQNREY